MINQECYKAKRIVYIPMEIIDINQTSPASVDRVEIGVPESITHEVVELVTPPEWIIHIIYAIDNVNLV